VVSLPLKILNISCAFAVSLLAMGFMLLIFLLSCLLCGSKLGEGKGHKEAALRFLKEWMSGETNTSTVLSRVSTTAWK